jgi:hypothetical protein
MSFNELTVLLDCIVHSIVLCLHRTVSITPLPPSSCVCTLSSWSRQLRY